MPDERITSFSKSIDPDQNIKGPNVGPTFNAATVGPPPLPLTQAAVVQQQNIPRSEQVARTGIRQTGPPPPREAKMQAAAQNHQAGMKNDARNAAQYHAAAERLRETKKKELTPNFNQQSRKLGL